MAIRRITGSCDYIRGFVDGVLLVNDSSLSVVKYDDAVVEGDCWAEVEDSDEEDEEG